MTLRRWALKPGELKPLSRAGLLLLAARCALRVEPWCPPGAAAAWLDGLEHVAGAAFDGPADSAAAAERARALSDRGALASDQLAATDEPLGRCMNYALLTLATGVRATALAGGPALKKLVIEAAKLSASIAGVLAHAGRVQVPRGRDGVEVACVAQWDAIRADIPIIAAGLPALETARDRVCDLRQLAPSWPGTAPAWAAGPGRRA